MIFAIAICIVSFEFNRLSAGMGLIGSAPQKPLGVRYNPSINHDEEGCTTVFTDMDAVFLVSDFDGKHTTDSWTTNHVIFTHIDLLFGQPHFAVTLIVPFFQGRKEHCLKPFHNSFPPYSCSLAVTIFYNTTIERTLRN
jgi:hypothetical protein